MIEFATTVVLLAGLSQLPAPQATPRPVREKAADLIVVSGLRNPAAFPPEALDLGAGGFAADEVGETRPGPVDAPRQAGVAAWKSPGGALVRAAEQGVKIDLPNGAELMLDPQGRIHFRADGSATLPARRGVDVVLGDGSRIAVRLSGGRGGRGAVDAVTVEAAGVPPAAAPPVALWQSSRAVGSGVRAAGHRRRSRPAPVTSSGLEFHVLGRGDVLYEVERQGPLVHCRRVLCARAVQHRYPPERIVVLGDPLARSLAELPGVMPEKSTDYPEGPQAAEALARLARFLFVRGIQRQPAGTVGERIVPLGGGADGGMSLTVVAGPAEGMHYVRLRNRHAEQPVCEWIVGHTTRLQLVRQDTGPGKPRYFQRSVPVRVD